MTRKNNSHEKEDKNEVKSAAGSATGKSVRPDSWPLPADEVEEREDTPIQEIPIGYPVSPEEFEELKKQAEERQTHESSESSAAQADRDSQAEDKD